MNDLVNYYYFEELQTPTFVTESTSKQLQKTIDYLKDKKKILLLCTSNRWSGSDDVPKSTLLARHIQEQLIGKAVLIDVTKLHIYDCEGNVSDKLKGNHCGTKDSVLKDKEKNPSGCHRCWCSINHEDDELWKITKELLQSDAVLFFGSVRWGQTNAAYQRLIERLTWLENRHSTLKETNILKNIEAGVIMVGQNWNGSDVVKTQKHVLEFYGFKIPNILSWNWQFTDNTKDETKESYEEAPKAFKKEFFSEK